MWIPLAELLDKNPVCCGNCRNYRIFLTPRREILAYCRKNWQSEYFPVFKAKYNRIPYIWKIASKCEFFESMIDEREEKK